MKIKRIKLDNFRQFFGRNNIIEFSVEDTRNVTLIHAENGVGKTTILNSILWCFYNKFTSDFEKKDELVNIDAYKDGVTECEVEVEFIHEGSTYSASRKYDSQNRNSELRLFVIIGGSYEPIRSDKRFLNSVIPEDMAEYFLFHGEGISNLQSNESNFRKAIRDILGFTLAEQAIHDFGKIKTKWDSKLARINSENEKFFKAKSKLNRINEDLKVKREEKQRIANKLDELEVRKVNLDEEILSCKITDATKIKSRIKVAEASVRSRTTNLEKDQERRQKLIGEFGWRIFGQDISEDSLNFIDTSTLTGKIPAPYDETLVQDILKSASCICGRDVVSGTAEYSAILSLLDTANTAEMKQKIMKARSFAETIGNRSKDFIESYSDLGRSISLLSREIASENDDIRQLNIDLDTIDDSKLKALRSSERDIKAKITQLSTSSRMLDREISDLDLTRVRLEKEADKHIPNNNESFKILKSIKYLEQLIKLCHWQLDETEKNSKSMIANDVNIMLSTFSRKDYTIKVSDSFNFSLVREDGQIVAKSKGEKLLLNLAFVSALIKLAEKRSKADGKFLQPGTVAPFIIDAPFGELDETYREATAKFLPENSQQLVLLLSSSHWRGTVGKTIQDRVGSEYVLVSHKKSKRNDKPLDQITINKNVYNQSEYDSSFNGTSITRIS